MSDDTNVVTFERRNKKNTNNDYEVEALWSCTNCGTIVFKVWTTGEVECVGCCELVQLRVTEDGIP